MQKKLIRWDGLEFEVREIGGNRLEVRLNGLIIGTVKPNGVGALYLWEWATRKPTVEKNGDCATLEEGVKKLIQCGAAAARRRAKVANELAAFWMIETMDWR